MKNDPEPDIGKHPGIYLRDLLDARGFTQRDLTSILGITHTGINMIIAGKVGISAKMSKALGLALGYPPSHFAVLQTAYDVARAADPDEMVSIRAKTHATYPIRAMMNRGWLHDSDAEDVQRQLARFFEVNDMVEIPYLAHAPKKTRYEEKEIPPAQLAWLFRVRQLANSMAVPRYSATALKKAIDQMKHMLIAPEEARQVPRLLSECGVRYVIVEPLPKSNIDGVCLWLNKDTPVIGMSARYDRIDNYWFVLRHECEHVLREHGLNSDQWMLDADIEGQRADPNSDLQEEEQEANDAAADFCVPSDALKSFIRRKHPIYSEQDVLGFAQIHGIAPGLIVGQLQHYLKRYQYLRHHLVKIRHIVLPNSIVDGWGYVAPS